VLNGGELVVNVQTSSVDCSQFHALYDDDDDDDNNNNNDYIN